MQTKSSKFWAYVALLTGGLLVLMGAAALLSYFGLPLALGLDDFLSINLGQMAAIYLGLGCGVSAALHGLNSIAGSKSSIFKMPVFYLFWIALALVLGLGSLIINIDYVGDYLFPFVFMLGAALSTLAVLAFAYRRLGWPLTWRQTALAFVCGSTLAIVLAIFLETTLPYLVYLLLSPLGYLADVFSNFGWGAPDLIEKLFASPLIVVFLIFTAFEAPIPEELAKMLAAPLFGRLRIQNERQAFAIGLASGAGFAILENMLYEGLYAGYNGWAWGGITLLRSIGAVLHPLCAGIVALGWYRMKVDGAGKLFKAYLLAVGLHTLWNGGFEPLVYLTGLDYFRRASFTFYGEALPILLVIYLILLSLGLWWLLRRIVRDLSVEVIPDFSPALVSRRALAAWALACALVIIPIGAALGSVWDVLKTMF